MALNLVNFSLLILKEEKKYINHKIVASLDVWQSYFAHTSSQVYY